MNCLNGWQRIWVVLMVMWTLAVGVLGYEGPTSVWHYTEYGEKEPYTKMADAVRQRMTRTPTWEGEDCEGLPDAGILLEKVENLPGLSAPVRLCFALKGIPERERQQIDAVVERMTAARESEANIKLVVDEMKRQAMEAQDPFSTRLTQEQIDAIKADYARAYREELRSLRRDHYQRMALVWFIPGVMLYAFGWSVGWVWRGFRKAPGSVQSP